MVKQSSGADVSYTESPWRGATLPWIRLFIVVLLAAAIADVAVRTTFNIPMPSTAVTEAVAHPSPTTAAIRAPTPVITTAPGTVLKVGEEWRTEGMLVSLYEVTWLPFDGRAEPVGLNFVIKNNIGKALPTNINSADWILTDNTGKRYQLRHAGDDNQDWHTTSVPLGIDVQIFLLKADVREVLNPQWFHLTIPEIGRVKNATWQFSIPR